ncbi:MAG: hypothetical protein JW884_14155 [Deltaproteobacteria bacterium]|nr:hypothetical protein [Deltaproteobacteria bacterium]
MKVVCPYCGKKLDMDLVIDDADWKAIIALSGSLKEYSSLVFAYLELFGLAPLSRNKKRVRVILEEVKRLFDAESFRYRKVDYRISRQGIAEALNIMIHRHFPDRIDNHNYLKKIMIGISEREMAAQSKRDEASLRDREERLRRGEHLSEEDMQRNRDRARALARGIFTGGEHEED